MTQHSGYLLEVLRSDGEFTLYRRREAGEMPVLALATTPQAPPQSGERLAHELALAPELDRAWAARPVVLTRHDGQPMLLLEDFGGEPLNRILAAVPGKPIELTRFLQLASDLSGALRQMHRRGLIHKDLKPANVLVDAAGHVRLTGFGIASRLPGERQVLEPPDVIVGTFAYMAPEQTGRMNRSMDARSDLYSLGVTLYELLTGTLPFTAADPTEWIHCHIARQPPLPSERVAGTPAVVDAIVMKLLAKDAADRYQTAAGVEADLRRCLAEWIAHRRVEAFTLGERDIPDRLLMPEKLYGREAEMDALLVPLERVVTRGSTELVLVSGYAGVGKSSIVNELRLLAHSRCLFASGKVDQYQRDIPYATLAQSLRGLTRQLLGKQDAELAVWRDAMILALGPHGQLMVNLIPELALIVGEQPPIPRVEPQEAQARFHVVFQNLLGVFARPEHPLVLFLDDLQWLDTATMELLERLVKPPGVPHLLLIGAYRDNEVGPSHPLSHAIAAMRAAGASVAHVTVGPLNAGHIARLTADALRTDVERVYPLAELVAEKTGGNPFFAIQFITALAEERLLAFDAEGTAWRWDVDRIRSKRITDNLADLLATKLSRLPAATRETLGQLACLGNVAEVRTVALVRGTSEDEVHATLRGAVEAGLVRRVNGSFAFTHDRVQEAGYASIPETGRAAEHLRIGRVLLSVTSPAELEENIFEIVNQLDRGAPVLEDLGERERVAELNLIAGQRAKTSSAYASAQTYFAAGRTLLGEDGWRRRYRLTLDLELQRAECEIVNREMAAAEERLATLAQHVTGLTDHADVVRLAVLLYFTTGRSERAVEVALEFLSRAGIEWSSHPREEDVRKEYVKMRRLLEERPLEGLIDRPPMTDPTCIAIMAVLMELFPAAYAIDRYLMELVLLRMTNLSLELGHSESSSVAYSALNMALGSHFGDYATAFGLGQIACELVEQRGADRHKARVYSCFAAFTMPWIRHLPLCRPMMIQAFQMGASTGDMAFAAYNARNLMTHLLISGVPLAEVQREAEEVMAFAKGIQLGLPAERFVMQLELVRQLRAVSTARGSDDDEWAEQNVEPYPQLAMMVCYHWVFKLQERYLSSDLDSALKAAAHVEDIRWAMRSSIEEADYDFYAALTRAAMSEDASAEEYVQHRRALSTHYERIAVWAQHCPENFANRQALVGAEIARLDGRELDAQRQYEDAVRLSRVHGFVQVEALANELAGRFHETRGLDTIADAYLRHARDCYERWGAVGKVRQLDARYPDLSLRTSSVSSAVTIDAPVAQLDVETVDKASQTLSSEMVLPTLIEKLMRLAIEHAGAERGVLILLHGDDPYIEAEATTGRGSVEVAIRRVKAAPSDLPQSVLQYALRTRERVVLDDASAGAFDSHDQYVSRHRSRSILCLPIFKEAKVIGALYLENNLTTRAFTPERVAVLDFLASQAAIWLENARLYSDLRRSEASLREAQHLALTGSFYWRVLSDTIEFSEQTFRTLDLDPTEAVTLDVFATRIHPEDLPLLREMIDVARGPGTDLDYTYRAQMPDQSVKHLHLVAHGTRDKDGQLEYIGAVQDVTQRWHSEDALGKARSELAHVARVMSLGALTASIAHEVNQPMAGIITNASTCLRMLAVDPPNLDGARETARRMIRDSNRASDVIRRLRALFAKTAATTEPVDLNAATREVIALTLSELQRNRVVLRMELADDLPHVVGDRVQLQQVILNLLLNASDAMTAVEDRPRQLLIKTTCDDGQCVRVSVQDVGAGITTEDAGKLFDAFYTTKTGGMGIGLSVSRSILERHNGRLWAAPNDGPGATFSFSIPLQPDAATVAPASGAADPRNP